MGFRSVDRSTLPASLMTRPHCDRLGFEEIILAVPLGPNPSKAIELGRDLPEASREVEANRIEKWSAELRLSIVGCLLSTAVLRV
ncbi:MAG TPA: hypothetical protein VMZ30_16555 [Pyrinomonadaceae bacterium]|nr:hypothetical protein [Pyrinomonadaceae bacterium]